MIRIRSQWRATVVAISEAATATASGGGWSGLKSFRGRMEISEKLFFCRSQ